MKEHEASKSRTLQLGPVYHPRIGALPIRRSAATVEKTHRPVDPEGVRLQHDTRPKT